MPRKPLADSPVKIRGDLPHLERPFLLDMLAAPRTLFSIIHGVDESYRLFQYAPRRPRIDARHDL